MLVEIEPDRCIGSGVCALVAPAVFDQNDDDGVVVLLNDHPPDADHDAAHEAAVRCPAAVIQVTDT